MAGIPMQYRSKDFQNSTYKKCSPLVESGWAKNETIGSCHCYTSFFKNRNTMYLFGFLPSLGKGEVLDGKKDTSKKAGQPTQAENILPESLFNKCSTIYVLN